MKVQDQGKGKGWEVEDLCAGGKGSMVHVRIRVEGRGAVKVRERNRERGKDCRDEVQGRVQLGSARERERESSWKVVRRVKTIGRRE